MRKDLVNAALVFTGLMLSPITWWNDPFVNIPISYLAASLLPYKLFPISFVLFYWLSNILGIFLMYIGGKMVIKDKISRRKQFFTVVIYGILISWLSIFGIIKPFSW